MQRRYAMCVSLYLLLVVTSSVFVNGFPGAAERLQEVQHYVIKRFKRGAVEFHKAIRCYQPTTNVLGSYGNYGCFCGISGKGEPLDETDRCCQIHDKCYHVAGEIEKNLWDCFISMTSHLLASYNYNCKDGEITCEDDTPYRRKLCECDKAAAECFYYASATYHPQLLHVDSKRYCSGNVSLDELNLSDYENRYVPKAKKIQAAALPTIAEQDIKRKEQTKNTETYKPKEEDLVIPRLINASEAKIMSDVNAAMKELDSDFRASINSSRRHRHRKQHHVHSAKSNPKKSHKNEKDIDPKSAAGKAEVVSSTGFTPKIKNIRKYESSTRTFSFVKNSSASSDGELNHNQVVAGRDFTTPIDNQFKVDTTKPVTVATPNGRSFDLNKRRKNFSKIEDGKQYSKPENEINDFYRKAATQTIPTKSDSSSAATITEAPSPKNTTAIIRENQSVEIPHAKSTAEQTKLTDEFDVPDSHSFSNRTKANKPSDEPSDGAVENRHEVDGDSAPDAAFDVDAVYTNSNEASSASGNYSFLKSNQKKSFFSVNVAPPNDSPRGGAFSCHQFTLVNLLSCVCIATIFLLI